MSVVCEIAAPFVANSAVDGTAVLPPLRPHTATCLQCQARHAAMTKTARELRALAYEQSEAPRDMEWRVMSSLEGELAIARSRKAPVAVVAALLSMAAAIVVWRLRPRVS